MPKTRLYPLYCLLTLTLFFGADPTRGTHQPAGKETFPSQAFAQTTTAGAKEPCFDAPFGLLAWWPLDENQVGGALVADIAGGHHGKTFPAPLGSGGPHPVPGAEEGAFHFNGTDQFVEVPPDPQLDFDEYNPGNPEAEDFTIDAWIFRDALTHHDAPIVSKWNGDFGYYFYLHDNVLALVLADGTREDLRSGVTLPIGQWVHVTVSVDRDDPNGAKFYVDGTFVADQDPTNRLGSLTNKEPLHIGKTSIGVHDSVLHPWFFEGRIDEVEIFDRALTPGEIHAIYWKGKCKCVEPPIAMEAWWTLDEPSGSVAADGANGHDGAHKNGPTPVPGKVARALRFNGIDTFVDVPHHPAFNFGTASDLTLDAWIRTSSLQPTQPILAKELWPPGAGVSTGYKLFLIGGHLTFYLRNGTSSTFGGFGVGPHLADGQWHFVAVTVDRDLAGVGGNLFVDGVLVDTFDPTTLVGSADNAKSLRIGAAPSSVGDLFHFEGEIDEVEVFRRALDPSELQAIYEAGADGKCKESAPKKVQDRSITALPR